MDHPGVIVDFYANWCPPCIEFKPKYAEMCKNNKNKAIIFATVCMDAAHEAATHLNVENIPAFFFFYRDHLQSKFTGMHLDKFTEAFQKLDHICGGESKDPDANESDIEREEQKKEEADKK